MMVDIRQIPKIKDLNSLVEFLSDQLEWPIDSEEFEQDTDTFSYSAEELGLNEKFSAMIRAVYQLRKINNLQPYTIFWVDFDSKRLPVTAMRRILRAFVQKKRGTAQQFAVHKTEDIIFISGFGEPEKRGIAFAHFQNHEGKELLREFYWDKQETSFGHIGGNLQHLRWPENEKDADGWRTKWSAAFSSSIRETISTSEQLAKSMARIARDIRDRIAEVYAIEVEDGPLHRLHQTFREGLIHDLTEKKFADMYAQTMTYGLFSARTMDFDGHFELHEVADLLPSTNPFLKKLLAECLAVSRDHHLIDLDEIGVGRLVELLDSLNKDNGRDTMAEIVRTFGRRTLGGVEDPVIHFYEEFLKEYDGIQRVEKGVYYTPDPVVDFIVRSVHEQLKTEFCLPMGLADRTTWEQMVGSGRAEYPKDPQTGCVNQQLKDRIRKRPFVQILDPATGTGTFLKRCISLIHDEVQQEYNRGDRQNTWKEHWNTYVENQLLPRLYGFELMMASYTVAHMTIGMHLKDLGYEFRKNLRLNIYLTNSLESPEEMGAREFFFSSVGAESAAAKLAKIDRFFSVVIGNPPYSGISSNNGSWIKGLIEDYKYVDGVHFKERKHWLGDDYVKFLRFGQFLIQKSGTGILGFINPHGFLDNTTFRGMRWNLLKSYDSIFAIDLHGNAKKQETAPDGSPDSNVFDITQGVSINFFILNKKLKSDGFSKMHHIDILGSRKYKYENLKNKSINELNFSTFSIIPSEYLFVPINMTGRIDYYKGFNIKNAFHNYTVGFITANDELNISFMPEEQIKKLEELVYMDEVSWRVKNKRLKDARDWQYKLAKKDYLDNKDKNIQKVSYRPFDYRFTLYTGNSRGLYASPQPNIMNHFISTNNLGIISIRNSRSKKDFREIFITDKIMSGATSVTSLDINYCFPLFLIDSNEFSIDFSAGNSLKANFKKDFIEEFERKLSLNYGYNTTSSDCDFSPLDVFDYIYSVLQSPSYRSRYQVFLKKDFPRVPYPRDRKTFWQLVKLGGEIRQIHLLEHPVVEQFITEYKGGGSNEVVKSEYRNGCVYINKNQYFEGVPEIAWNFYIGGYQPAQKWLKDRKGRLLSEEDIAHYQKIIVALTETHRLMQEIDEVGVEW